MKKDKLQQLIHLVAGIIVLIYGFDSFEAGDFLSATVYLTMAIIFLIVSGTHKWIMQKFMKADVAFFLLESATILYSGWRYKLHGHLYLFYTMLAAATLYFVFAVASLFAKDKPKRHSRKRKRRKRASLFDETKLGDPESSLEKLP